VAGAGIDPDGRWCAAQARPCDARSEPFCKSIEEAVDSDAAPKLDADDFNLFNFDNVMPGRCAESCLRAAADLVA